MLVELTDELFDSYCDAFSRWETTEEWMSRDDVDGEGDNKLKA